MGIRGYIQRKESNKGNSPANRRERSPFFSSKKAVQNSFFGAQNIQPKLQVDTQDSGKEQETDRIADEVVGDLAIENPTTRLVSSVKPNSNLSKNTVQLQRGSGYNYGVAPARAAQLRRMARDPGNFIGRWNSRRMSEDEHAVVIEAMDGYYGSNFTDQFVRYAEAGQLSTGGFITSHRNTPEFGLLSHERLRQRGYALMRPSDRVLIQRSEVWIHPSGHSIIIGPANEEAPQQQPEPLPLAPEQVTIPPNPEAVYGPRVTTVEGEAMRAMFPCQSASLFENGNIECYNDDGSIYTLIPQGSSRNPTVYAGYDDDGVQTITWIDENDIAGRMRASTSRGSQ